MQPDTIKLIHSVITQFEHYEDTLSLEADPFMNSETNIILL